MSKIGVVERDGEVVGYLVKSPATQAHVLFYTNPKFSPVVWNFDGDMDNPTFSPSMLLHENNVFRREHFFVKNGKIIYLGDCNHNMRGMTVDMVDVDDDDTDEDNYLSGLLEEG